jgi:hypothetical protein
LFAHANLQALRIPDLEQIEMPHAFGWGHPPSENEAGRTQKIPWQDPETPKVIT